MKLKCVLDEGSFRDLVSGRVARPQTGDAEHEVEIILSDIGWSRMLLSIVEAMDEERRIKPVVVPPLG